jgi:hypothetical protein
MPKTLHAMHAGYRTVGDAYNRSSVPASVCRTTMVHHLPGRNPGKDGALLKTLTMPGFAQWTVEVGLAAIPLKNMFPMCGFGGTPTCFGACSWLELQILAHTKLSVELARMRCQ